LAIPQTQGGVHSFKEARPLTRVAIRKSSSASVESVENPRAILHRVGSAEREQRRSCICLVDESDVYNELPGFVD